MEIKEHLREIQEYAADLAGNSNKTARIFWRLVERLPWRQRYELIQELESRNWAVPRYLRRYFKEFYEMQPEYEARQEYFDFRRGWLADKYGDQRYWRMISGGN